MIIPVEKTSTFELYFSSNRTSNDIYIGVPFSIFKMYIRFNKKKFNYRYEFMDYLRNLLF
jgi:hypothetical protein